MMSGNNEDLGLLQPLVNAYNGIDSRLPKVPYTGKLSSKHAARDDYAAK